MRFIHFSSHAVSSRLPSNRPWQRGQSDGSVRRLCAWFLNFFSHFFTRWVTWSCSDSHAASRLLSVASESEQEGGENASHLVLPLLPLFASRLFVSGAFLRANVQHFLRPVRGFYWMKRSVQIKQTSQSLWLQLIVVSLCFYTSCLIKSSTWVKKSAKTCLCWSLTTCDWFMMFELL